MSNPNPNRQPPVLPSVPGFPPAQSYAQYQLQLQKYQQQQAMKLAASQPQSTMTKLQPTLAAMGMGFGMGCFVGGSVGVLHTVMSKQPIKGSLGRIAGGAFAFGVIFSVGGILRG